MCGTQALATLFRMDIGPGYVSRRGGRVCGRCDSLRKGYRMVRCVGSVHDRTRLP